MVAQVRRELHWALIGALPALLVLLIVTVVRSPEARLMHRTEHDPSSAVQGAPGGAPAAVVRWRPAGGSAAEAALNASLHTLMEQLQVAALTERCAASAHHFHAPANLGHPFFVSRILCCNNSAAAKRGQQPIASPSHTLPAG